MGLYFKCSFNKNGLATAMASNFEMPLGIKLRQIKFNFLLRANILAMKDFFWELFMLIYGNLIYLKN